MILLDDLCVCVCVCSCPALEEEEEEEEEEDPFKGISFNTLVLLLPISPGNANLMWSQSSVFLNTDETDLSNISEKF